MHQASICWGRKYPETWKVHYYWPQRHRNSPAAFSPEQQDVIQVATGKGKSLWGKHECVHGSSWIQELIPFRDILEILSYIISCRSAWVCGVLLWGSFLCLWESCAGGLLLKKTKLAKYIYHISYHSKLSPNSFSLYTPSLTAKSWPYPKIFLQKEIPHCVLATE